MDGAVLDVSSFAKRHPGGARLIMNILGTDVTSEIIGDVASIGNFNRAFTPHTHTNVSSNCFVVLVRALLRMCRNSGLEWCHHSNIGRWIELILF